MKTDGVKMESLESCGGSSETGDYHILSLFNLTLTCFSPNKNYDKYYILEYLLKKLKLL